MIRRQLIPTFYLALSLALPGVSRGQEMSPVTVDVEAIRSMLLHGLEQHRAMDLEFTRAIPDTALRWKPTPEVRDFAEQIEHIALDNANFVVWGGIRDERPEFGDRDMYLNDPAALERVVNDSYDWVIASLRTLPPRELLVSTELFGQTLERWRVYTQLLAHADWTRGQPGAVLPDQRDGPARLEELLMGGR